MRSPGVIRQGIHLTGVATGSLIMNVIRKLFGITDCVECGRTIYFGATTCHGYDIDRKQKADCWGSLCRSCTYKLEYRNEDNTLKGVERYCKYHFQWFLFQLSMDELEELQYHGSVKTAEDTFVCIYGSESKGLLEKVIDKKRSGIR